MQSKDSKHRARLSSASDSSTTSIATFVDDGFSESCFWKHCQIDTRGSTPQVANFYMRSHLRTSHDNCRSPLKQLECNPFYTIEEYCGVTLGRDVERMLAVKAEDVLWRGLMEFRTTRLIAPILRAAIKRVEEWEQDSKLRVDDVRAYLEWQVEALGETLSWYYEESWLRAAVDEHIEVSPPEILPRTCDEVSKHELQMLRCGRFDDFDRSDEEEERPTKRRRKD